MTDKKYPVGSPVMWLDVDGSLYSAEVVKHGRDATGTYTEIETEDGEGGSMKSEKYYECGICGHCHPAEWDGDCREDANRFTEADLERLYGAYGDGWVEVPMPGTEGAP